MTKRTFTPSLKMIWGMAKSEELQLTSDELHLIVIAQTGKESMKGLTQKEMAKIVAALQKLKDSATKATKKASGNPVTASQRKKIEMLTKELGWEDEKRLCGMCRRLFRLECVEWLNYQQCSKLIEALKCMAARLQKEGE